MISDRRSDQPHRSTSEQIAEQELFHLPTFTPRLNPGWYIIVVLAAALFLGLGLLGAIWTLARPLALLILGLAIAAALASPVAWLSRLFPRLLSIIVVYLFIVAVVIGLGWLAVPPLIAQIQEFNESIPATFEWLQGRIEQVGLLDIEPLLQSALDSLSSIGGEILALPLVVSDTILDILLVFFLSIYSLVTAPAARDFIQSLTPETRRADVQHILDEMVEGMGGYLRGTFIIGLFVGIFSYLGLRFIGVPYPVVLGVVAGVLEVVPVIGTTISLIVVTGAALTVSASTALLTFSFMVVMQLVEGNILFPNIVGRQTHSSPLLSMFAFFAGISVGGILGGLISVPLAAAIRVILIETVAPAVRRWTGAIGSERTA